MSFLTPFLDTLLGFLLNWPPVVAIIFVSLIISLASLLVTKFTTDQAEMKRLKEELDLHQKKMKTLRDQPDKMMKVQQEALKLQGHYFKKSMIPTLVTLIPLGLILGWMSDHYSYQPLIPNQEFQLTVTAEGEGNISVYVPEGIEVTSKKNLPLDEGKARFNLKGEEGIYNVAFEYGTTSVEKEVIITAAQLYSPVEKTYTENIKKVELGNMPLNVFWKIGWLGTYIISAILFITVLRKILKVY